MKYVLFVCTHNAGRSQIARPLFERYAPSSDLQAESAGQAPAEAIWPNVVEPMGEIGIDLSERRPKRIGLEVQLHEDKAITLNCQGTCPYVIGGVEDWDVADPAGRPIEEVRVIRDEIERRVRGLLERARRDPRRPERTRAPARTAPAAGRGGVRRRKAPVRSFALTLAERRARECLRQPNCALIA